MVYIEINRSEIMIRNIEAREGMTRPSMRMIGHTTYLAFARKVTNINDDNNTLPELVDENRKTD